MKNYSRVEIAAVVLALAGKPLHYDSDLNYIAEVIRNRKSSLTPWRAMGSHLGRRYDIFSPVGDGMYDLVKIILPRQQFVAEKIGEKKYYEIVDLLKNNGFIDDNGQLKWTPHSQYRHLVDENKKISSLDLFNVENNDQNGWFPKDYSPEISVEKWVELLKNPEIFNENSLKIMARMQDLGGMATCKQLANKYGASANFYNSGSSYLAKRIYENTKCPILEEHTENSRWWPILYVGRYNEDKNVQGVYIWKLRSELSEALKQINLSDIKLYEEAEEILFDGNTENIYTKENFLKEVFISEDKYDSLKMMLEKKKNIILQGAPGVGKTFAARRLAYSIMGVKDDSKIEIVQFHQNYSYEDFVMGYKPDGDGFKLTEGIFYKFCINAAKQPDKKFFFIIDEINRGNMSKIFGELLMLLENNYRDKNHAIKFAYKDEKFYVPENLYIIGMMNTADRSLAMIDYALRRRFSFFDMEPGFDTDGFKAKINSDKFRKLIDAIKDLNNVITNDKSLGKGFCIGHSYFCDKEGKYTDEELKSIVEFDILPMLAEYWFDEPQNYEKWQQLLMGIFNE